MQPSRPIDRDIRRPFVDPFSSPDTSAGADRAELKDAFERRAVFARETARTVAGQLFGRLGKDLFEEVDVFVGVETGELGFGCTNWPL